MMSKTIGSLVMSGAINGESALTIRADKLSVDSRYAKIMEVMRSSENYRPNIRRLGDQLGALYTPLLEQGEWWRLLSAQFMHWGVLHLFCNMLGLWFLGPLTESILGPLRYIMAYLLCGAGGMLVAFGASLVATTPHSIVLLGASASVLGLVGIQAAFSLKAFRRSGSMVAKAQLASMLQIVVLQGIFDLLVPKVSSTAHIGGAAVGFVLGTFIFMRR